MGQRIACSKAISDFVGDPAARAEINELLDYDICPRSLVGNDLRQWLLKAWAADEIRSAFAVLLEDLYFVTWAPAISKHIPFSSTRRLLKNERESAIAKSLIDDIWTCRTYERQAPLPVFSLRKSTFPSLRCSVLVDVSGFVVLAFAIDRPFRIKRLAPAGGGWILSQTSGYFFPSKVRLEQTRKLDVSALVEAAENAVKAVAEFYVPEHLRRPAA